MSYRRAQDNDVGPSRLTFSGHNRSLSGYLLGTASQVGIARYSRRPSALGIRDAADIIAT